MRVLSMPIVLLIACSQPAPVVSEPAGQAAEVEGAATADAGADAMPAVNAEPPDADPQKKPTRKPFHRKPAKPWKMVAAPTTDDCWQPADVKQRMWKMGDMINALSFEATACSLELYSAVEDKDLAALKRLIREAGEAFDVNCRADYEWTLLHVAAQAGATKIARLLIRKGVPARACDMTGRTPLHDAVGAGRLPVAKLLLAKGAYADAVDIWGGRPIHLVWLGAYDVGSGTDYKLAYALLTQLVRRGVRIDVANKEGETPLHIAAAYGDLASVKYLVKKGASTQARDHRGNTPLASAREAEAPGGAAVAAYLEKLTKSK